MSKLEQIQALRAARVARNSSRGGGESRPATDKRGLVPETSDQSNRPANAQRVANGEQAPARSRGGSRIETSGVAPGPRETKPKRKAKAKKPKPAKAPKAPKVRIGRPRVEDRGKTLSDLKPWLQTDPPMSRATYYRRKQGKA